MQAIGNLLSQPLPAQDNDSQPYSKGIPNAWLAAVETIFERFAIHYGAARMNAYWVGVDVDKSKSYWARKLVNLERRNLAYALANLPEFPPSADEFLSIARRCPLPPFVALPYKDSEEEKQSRREYIEKIKQQFFGSAA